MRANESGSDRKIPRAAAALGCALVASLAGCGGGGENGPEASVASYLTALEEGHAAAVCGLIGSETLAEIGSIESCERMYAAGLELLAERGGELPPHEVLGSSVDGDTATVTIEVGGREQEVELVSEDGEWKLDGATALSQFHPDLVPGKFP